MNLGEVLHRLNMEFKYSATVDIGAMRYQRPDPLGIGECTYRANGTVWVTIGETRYAVLRFKLDPWEATWDDLCPLAITQRYPSFVK